MLTLKHRTASGGNLTNMWEYDPARRVLELVIREASGPTMDLTVPVCVSGRPRLGAHIITRVNEETWRILPSHYGLVSLDASREWRNVGHRVQTPTPMVLASRECATLHATLQACRLHSVIGWGAQVFLTNAPRDVQSDLEALAHA